MPGKTEIKFYQTNAQHISRLHFLYIAAYIGSIVVFDMWNLIAREAVGQRWMAAALLLLANTIGWYVARMKLPNPGFYKSIVLTLITFDVLFVATNVYWERGMASLAVAQFAVPLLLAASLKSRGALLGTATLCAGAYSVSAVRYFFDNYGEGYRVQLYGTVGFHVALFFVLAWLLISVVRPDNRKP
ncbi:MAG TPA: hypothetical protein VGA08_01835 [Candidatus Saccharimonadales bacterium]